MRQGVSPRLRWQRLSTASLLQALLHRTLGFQHQLADHDADPACQDPRFGTSNTKSVHMAARHHLSGSWPMSVQSRRSRASPVPVQTLSLPNWLIGVALAGCYPGLAASTVVLLTPKVLVAPCRILAH